MTKTIIWIDSNDPAMLKRFSRWLKCVFNAQYPSAEWRGKTYTSQRWDVVYYNDWVIGNSEQKLRDIADCAITEHLFHANPTKDFYVDYEIYSV